jgi:hypothetical protein
MEMMEMMDMIKADFGSTWRQYFADGDDGDDGDSGVPMIGST